MVYDKPIIIQKRNEDTEKWEDLYSIHARVNKSNGTETFNAGAEQSKATRVFEVRYFKNLEDIDANRGLYRIMYRGRSYNLIDYDDYLEQHKTIKLTGVTYG